MVFSLFSPLLRRLALIALPALLAAPWLPASAQLQLASNKAGPVVTTPHVRAELVAYAPEGVTAGAPVWVGLQIEHQPGWHTYWKNAGDSGLPTELAWSLPAGITSGDIAWPVPTRFDIGNLANYGYEGTALLPVPLQIGPDFKAAAPLVGAAALDIQLKASWLVCSKECIPEDGEFRLSLPLHGSTALHKSDFDAALAAQPAPLAQPGSIRIEGNSLQVKLDGLPPASRGKSLQLFAETPEVIWTAAVPGKDLTQAWQGDSWTATLPLAEHRGASPSSMPLVVALAEADRKAVPPGQPFAWRAEAPVSGDWPATRPAAQVSPALQAALAANAAAGGSAPAALAGTGTTGGGRASGAGASGAGGANPASAALAPQPAASLLAALVGALIGGLLLNLMPCVFPVLAIKVLGFTRHAADRRAHRLAALAYSAGVILSFLALGGAMLALRAAGAQLGWGFQLQSPAVVAALAALFTLIGLNLAGLFEVGQLGPSALYTVQARHPVVNDFLSGVLAVVVASPCTAPFMGASLGYAIGLPAAQALLLFAVLGFGLALPYLTAGFVPAVARLLPKPGAWMQTLRRLLAFPMFATVAWLVWVLGQQSGIDGAGALLGLLVCLAAVAWALSLRGRTRWVLGSLALAATVALGNSIGGNVLRPLEPGSAVASQSAEGERWQPWSQQRADDLMASGRPVFVDFTAAWCVTCQYNKRSTLADDQVLADFDAKKVALLRADWTRRDPAISAALGALGRSGVPVYLLQAPGRPPQVLTEILGRDELRAALAAL